jgi:hypothetical protein
VPSDFRERFAAAEAVRERAAGKSHLEVREMLFIEIGQRGIEASPEQIDFYMYSIFKSLSADRESGSERPRRWWPPRAERARRALKEVMPQYSPSRRTILLHPDYSRPGAEVELDEHVPSRLARHDRSTPGGPDSGQSRLDVWLSRDAREQARNTVFVNDQNGRLGSLPSIAGMAFSAHLDEAKASGFTLMARGYLQNDADGVPHLYIYLPGQF